MDRDTELDLVRRLGAKDTTAFDAVYAEYHVRLFGFLVRLSRSRDIADDLAEETWMRFVTHAPRLRPDTSLAAWLFTVARRLYYSHCRSRLVEDAGLQGLLGLWPVCHATPSPFDETAAGELERRLDEGLAALPSRYRDALLLVGVEGFTPSEAAAICGVRPEAFRQRLSRARAMLLKEMGTRHAASGQLVCEVTV